MNKIETEQGVERIPGEEGTEWPTDNEFLDAATSVCEKLGCNPTESEHAELAILISGWLRNTF